MFLLLRTKAVTANKRQRITNDTKYFEKIIRDGISSLTVTLDMINVFSLNLHFSKGDISLMPVREIFNDSNTGKS